MHTRPPQTVVRQHFIAPGQSPALLHRLTGFMHFTIEKGMGSFGHFPGFELLSPYCFGALPSLYFIILYYYYYYYYSDNMQHLHFLITKTFTGQDELMFQGKQQSEIFPQLPDTPWTYLEPGARTQSRHRCVYGNTSRTQGSRRRPCTWG